VNRAGRALLLIAIAVAPAAWAGGPLLVGGPKFGLSGQAFVWDNSVPIVYATDGGNLGVWDNATANSHVAAAFALWGAVPTASLSFQRAGPIAGIADVNSMATFNQAMGSCQSGAQTPIIYDSDGSLTSQLTDPNVLGFASPCLLSPSGKIQTGYAVLNGTKTGLMDGTMVHEFGHLLGLDHTQLNCRAMGCQAEDNAHIPTMFPVLFSNTQPQSLEADDIAWISKLYPSASFGTQYGTITGRVLFSDGVSPVQDAVLIARQVPRSPAGVADQSPAIAVSTISGYYFTGNPGQTFSADYLPCTGPSSGCKNGFFANNTDGSKFGSRDPSLIGYYEIPVPPGLYTLEVRTIGNGYTHDDIGPIDVAIDLPGPEEFWNAHESATDDAFALPGSDVLALSLDAVSVSAGATTAGVDFILNGTAPTADEFDSGALVSMRFWKNAGTVYAWLRMMDVQKSWLLARSTR